MEKANEKLIVDSTVVPASDAGMIERPHDITSSMSQQHLLQQRSLRGGGHSETTGSRLRLL